MVTADDVSVTLVRGLQPGQRGYTTGRLALDGEPMCTVPMCFRVSGIASTRQYCVMHQARVRKHGHPGTAGPLRPYAGQRPCRVDDCDNNASYAETLLCKKHGRAHALYGDPNVTMPPGIEAGPEHPNIVEVPTYAAVHYRLRSWRGAARAYWCADECGRQAAEWSYDGTDPEELADPNHGNSYTTDLSRYVPRCHPCHRAHDAAARGHRRSRTAEAAHSPAEAS